MTKPKISFVMPCYKDGKTLETAVKSILDQDLKELEVIIVNDGSPDDSEKVIKKLKKDKRVKSILFKTNKGACAARNAGAKLARGKYLSFLPADAFLYPGNARVWVEALDERPEYDFLYGGYAFVKEGTLSPFGGEKVFDYKSEPFDPYLLEVKNYIDGSFPMRRELFDKIGGWDTSIKSLQDWEFWLRAVLKGAKGLFYQDIFFETEYPHVGGLSHDSANNWIERSNTIKKKLGIPFRKVCVASLGAAWHAKNIAKLLNADFQEMPSFKPHEYEVIYSIGFYPQFGDMQGSMFMNQENRPDLGYTSAKKIIHFVGSDILQFKYLSFMQLELYRQFFKNNIDVLLCEDKFTQDELKELKIDAQIQPIPPIKLFPLTPLPKEFTVAVYMPQTNKELYQPQLMVEVAKMLPDIKFKFFGDPYERKVEGNIEYMGYLQRNEMEELVKSSSCLLRMPTHDGLSLTSLEYILAGRQVVSSTPVRYAQYVEKPDKYYIVNALKQAQKAGQNTTGSKYWRDRLDHKKYKQAMEKWFEYDPKAYWEKRAENWDKQAGDKLPDIEKLEPLFLEIKPETILDVGCGSGRWYPYFKKQGVKYRGIDISENLVRMAQQKFPQGMFKTAKVEDIPKPPIKFDLAFCYTTLEHVTEKEFPKAVKALKQCAKKLILVEPVNFKSRHYCHVHLYNQHFNVIKEIPLEDKVIFVIDNDNNASKSI